MSTHVSASHAPIPAAPRRADASMATDAFCDLFRGHAGGVAVITADAGEGPVALTATSVTSTSVDPPLLVFSVSARSSASGVLARAESVVVHLLDAADIDIARRGATSGIDRFDGANWSRLVTGEPVFHDVRGWIRCRVVNRMDAGTATVIAAQALQGHEARPVAAGEHGDALVYHNRTWHRLGAHSRIE